LSEGEQGVIKIFIGSIIIVKVLRSRYRHNQKTKSRMLKKYPEFIAPNEELKIEPSISSINAILNYSKSLEVKRMKNNKVNLLISLN
jgi:hypothetical protein